MPNWLHTLALASLALSAVIALWTLVDVYRHPPHMGIMKAVWPLAMLFGSFIGLAFYFRYGRAGSQDVPYSAKVGKGALHCGAGCTLGDIIAETLAAAVPAILIWFGYESLFNHEIFAVWVFDFVLAFAIGIVFQYFAIAPMRDLGLWAGLRAAIKADTLSLTAWQVGMYGFMAFAHFYVFKQVLGIKVDATSPVFWFAMQFAMICGFATAYPVNWWLIRQGIKEEM